MTTFTPFPYQRDCLERLEETRRQDISRALVVMATGLGKTVVAALDAKEVIEKKSWRVLYLAHQNQILEQAKETFEEILGDSATYGFFTGDEKVLDEVTCLFASFQTMANWREDFYEDEFDYVIVDESHHSHAETYLPTIKYFKPKFLLAITATPDRKDLRNIRELYGNEVFSITLEEALAKGYLTPVEYLLLIDEIQAQQVIETPSGKLSIRELNRRLFIPMRDETIVAKILEKSEGVKNPRMLIFCSSIRHCENIAALMPNAAALHSKVHFSDRRTRLEAFRSGEISTLVTVDQFNEGIDIPAANVLVFLRSTSSRTIFLQQLGRGLRRAEGKASVLVLDFAGNCERIEKVAELASNIRRLREEFDSPGGTQDEHVGRDSFVMDHEGEFYFTELVQDVLSFIGEVRTGYTRESVIAQLQKLAVELGRSPTHEDCAAASKRGTCASPALIYKLFGGHSQALKAAGLEVNQTRYTRETLIDQLQKLSVELGRAPKKKDINEAHKAGKTASVPTFSWVFGSLNKALEAAGLTLNRVRYTREDILRQLRELVEKLGHVPTKPEIDAASRRGEIASSSTIGARFKGGVQAALKEAGVNAPERPRATPKRKPPRSPAKRYTQEEILESLRQLAAELGHTPTQREIKAASKTGKCAAPTTIATSFGSLTDALSAAGLGLRRFNNLSDEELLEFLKQLANDLGRTPTNKDVGQASSEKKCPSPSAFAKRFGSYNAALQAAGLEPTRTPRKR